MKNPRPITVKGVKLKPQLDCKGKIFLFSFKLGACLIEVMRGDEGWKLQCFNFDEPMLPDKLRSVAVILEELDKRYPCKK